MVTVRKTAFLWAEGLCACLLALLGEMNAVIMLAASCKYWYVNKKDHVLVIHKLCMHRYIKVSVMQSYALGK